MRPGREFARQLKSWLRRPRPRIRRQLLLGFVLSGFVSVVLLLGFTAIFIQMLVQRAAVNVVERQIELAAHALLDLAESAAARGGPATAPALGPGLPLRISLFERRRAGESPRVPAWITQRSFHGAVFDSGGLSVRAAVCWWQGAKGPKWQRHEGPRCHRLMAVGAPRGLACRARAGPTAPTKQLPLAPRTVVESGSSRYEFSEA